MQERDIYADLEDVRKKLQRSAIQGLTSQDPDFLDAVRIFVRAILPDDDPLRTAPDEDLIPFFHFESPKTARSENMAAPEDIDSIRSQVELAREVVFHQGVDFSQRQDLLSESVEEGLMTIQEARERYTFESPKTKLFASKRPPTSNLIGSSFWLITEDRNMEIDFRYEFDDTYYLQITFYPSGETRRHLIYDTSERPLSEMPELDAKFVNYYLNRAVQENNSGSSE